MVGYYLGYLVLEGRDFNGNYISFFFFWNFKTEFSKHKVRSILLRIKQINFYFEFFFSPHFIFRAFIVYFDLNFRKWGAIENSLLSLQLPLFRVNYQHKILSEMHSMNPMHSYIPYAVPFLFLFFIKQSQANKKSINYSFLNKQNKWLTEIKVIKKRYGGGLNLLKQLNT